MRRNRPILRPTPFRTPPAMLKTAPNRPIERRTIHARLAAAHDFHASQLAHTRNICTFTGSVMPA